MSNDDLRVCIVGAAPRGLSVLERLCANEAKSASRPAVVIHVVDSHRPGAGRVWRTAQSRVLLMNTVASQITVYTDDSVEMEGPIEPGPSLHDWARALAAGTGDPEETYDEEVLSEARSLGPDAYPTRAFYGAYLEAAFRQVVAGAPPHVSVCVHQARAVALTDTGRERDGGQTLFLDSGRQLEDLDAVVLAQGHVPARTTAVEADLTRTAGRLGLTYLPPANPADLALDAIAPGESVLLRGLGLNFFDHVALLTLGRGGTFDTRDGRLVYRPSGREPRIHAGSRRGMPYHARGENEKGPSGRYFPRLLTPAAIDRLRERSGRSGQVVFGTDIWPLIAKDVESVYYGALLAARGRSAERDAFVAEYLSTSAGPGRDRLLDDHGIAATDRWDWDRVARPYGNRRFAGRADFAAWLTGHLAEDVREARAGNLQGPLKAALDVLRDLRNEIRLAVDHGALEGNSYRDELESWYTPLNAFLSIGPPASRIEELVALIDAGVVELVGPELRVRVDTAGPAFVAESRIVDDEPVRATALIEARLPEPDLRRTADPLLRQLSATGQCRPHRIPGAYGTSYETGGLDVTERPYRIIDAHGRAHPRRFAYGVPTEGVHWVTAAGIRPGVNSVTLGDADAIAHAVLALPPISRQDTHAGHAGRRPASGRTKAEQ